MSILTMYPLQPVLRFNPVSFGSNAANNVGNKGLSLNNGMSVTVGEYKVTYRGIEKGQARFHIKGPRVDTSFSLGHGETNLLIPEVKFQVPNVDKSSDNRRRNTKITDNRVPVIITAPRSVQILVEKRPHGKRS